tara:strand:- start:4911 stop:6263 length:1353 start_codon:yes stop_codon:yes gene_type:complete
MIRSINPSTGNIIKEYDLYSDDSILAIIKDVNQEYLLWKKVSFSDRAKVLFNISDSLKSDIEKHAKMISLEMGKPIVESRQEIEKCIWVLRYFAENSEEFLKSESIKTDYKESYIQHDPLGIIFGVMPWNFPYWQVLRFIAPVLMSGNTCIVKHAPNVSGCSLMIEKLIMDNSPFKNIFRSIICEVKSVKSIIENKAVKGVSLTGSDIAGSAVASYAGKEIKRTVLELGGSDAFIVLDDADINQASKTAVMARFFNTGQSCIAAKRFLVHEDVYDQFILNVKSRIERLVVGDPLDSKTQIGPLAKYEFVKKIEGLVQSSINSGAKCLIKSNSDGCFYRPVLLVDVDEEMPVFQHETFGPVFCVSKIKKIDDAIRIANNSKYGLGGSVWTSDIEKAKFIASQINTGAVFINDMTKSDPRLPFGGVNNSGYGIELSKYGIKEFVNVKTIVVK